MGDSITHTGSYHTWMWLFHLTRFPTLALDVANCGIAGDTATGAMRRLRWDILSTRPTLATVMFGMNDVGLALYASDADATGLDAKRRAALDAYERNLRALVAALQRADSRVVLLTPSIFDQRAELAAARRPGIDAAMASCAEFVRRLGTETGVAVVDVFQAMLALSDALRGTDPAFTLVGPDRIHPGESGYFTMAWLILKAQGVPAEVSHLAIDAATGALSECRNGVVSDVRGRAAAGVSFTFHAAALPFPIDPSFAGALRWVPFMTELNRETLLVTSLPVGHYVLSIDDSPVGVFSNEEFARGLNLAEQSGTPQYRQALEVLRLVQAHRLHTAETLRNIALVEHQAAPSEGQPYTWAAARLHHQRRLEQLRAVEPVGSNLLRIYDLYPTLKPAEAEHRQHAVGLAAEARRVAQPRAHRYTIARVGG